jgi:hypothetical protein
LYRTHPAYSTEPPYELRDSSDDRDEEALASIRAFLEKFGVHPTAEAWTATGMTPK